MKRLGRYISRLLGRSLTFILAIRLPPCVVDLAVSWHKNLDNRVTETITTTINGLLAFDGTTTDDDYVDLGSGIDVSGDCVVSFSANLNSFNSFRLLELQGDTDRDYLSIIWEEDVINVSASSIQTNRYDNSSFQDQNIDIVITKTSYDPGGGDPNVGSIVSITVNGNTLTRLGSGSNNYNNGSFIGAFGATLADSFFWDLNINDEHAYIGYPDGNLDSAWIDTIGSSDGTVYGSPVTGSVSEEASSQFVKDEIGTRTDDVYYGQYLDTTSGQINFYRTSGTFDYTDPSDGSLVEGVSIPATGLYTVPANGICDIGVYPRTGIAGAYIYTSFYPTIEGAGTVLHDVMENSKHISVNTPSWSESLYGSDYLNQNGFVDKADSDALGYDWETNVNGLPVTLNDNTLIPLAQWEYVDLIDSEGENILDSEGEQIQVKQNI